MVVCSIWVDCTITLFLLNYDLFGGQIMNASHVSGPLVPITHSVEPLDRPSIDLVLLHFH